MVCKECGKEIADGMDYCPECGAPVEEPIVIKMSKDDIKKANKELEKKEKENKKISNKIQNRDNDYDEQKEYQGSFINLIGYVKSLAGNMSKMLSFAGAVLLYISPFLAWLYQELHKVRTSGNLFDLGSKVVKDQWGTEVNTTITLGSKFFSVMAIVILLSGFCMMVFSAREYIKPMWKYRNKLLIRFIPVVTSIIAFVLIFTNKHYKELIDNYKSLKEIAKSTGSTGVFSYGHGLGPILCAAGIILYFISILFDLPSKRR